ncbi:MAG TPA: hypothetical protein VFB98_06165, partial [Candidatus Deferrimicrobium sp.]|nr:hypothetical protein [Candidatus Deferrimicrobium sp.]
TPHRRSQLPTPITGASRWPVGAPGGTKLNSDLSRVVGNAPPHQPGRRPLPERLTSMVGLQHGWHAVRTLLTGQPTPVAILSVQDYIDGRRLT